MAWSLANQWPCVPQDSGLYLKELIEPVLTCFNDADSRLRYYACEALYNIVKVARGSVLPHFNVLFDGLSKVRSFLLTPMCFFEDILIISKSDQVVQGFLSKQTGLL